MVIRINLNPLEAKTAFPYFRITVTYNNSDLVELYSNLRKSHRRWGVLAKVLGKMGARVKSRFMMYKAVVLTFLLYGRKRWVVTDAKMTVLGGFHHRIVRQITGITARKSNGR